jgi:DNA-binding response OmpR family regulator
MTKHILLVDDDALLRRSLAYNLERAGYQPTAAAGAEDALALARHIVTLRGVGYKLMADV